MKQVKGYTFSEQNVHAICRLGQVFKAKDCCIKRYSKQQLKPFLKAILLQEIAYLQAYPMKYVTRVLAYDETADSVYKIEELYDISLRQQINDKGKLEIQEVHELFRCVMIAYCQMIQMNIFHLDLHPEGIVFKDHQYYLTDLGFGAISDRFADYAKFSIYNSPQRNENQPYTSKADVWSFGVILYEAMYGLLPQIKNQQVTLQIDLDKSDPLQKLMLQMMTYHEDNRPSWEQIFDDPYVQVITKYKHIFLDNAELSAQFRALVEQTDIYLLFAMNSESKSMNELTRKEFLKGVRSNAPKSDEDSVMALFDEIMGPDKDKLTDQGLKEWLKRDALRLKGPRGYHRKLTDKQQKEYDAQEDRKVNWKKSLDLTNLNKHLFSAAVRSVLLNLRKSIKAFQTPLKDLFLKYDPNNLGGINKQNLDRMILKIYPEGLDDVTLSRVFQFLNQSGNALISIDEFEYVILKLDLEKLPIQN